MPAVIGRRQPALLTGLLACALIAAAKHTVLAGSNPPPPPCNSCDSDGFLPSQLTVTVSGFSVNIPAPGNCYESWDELHQSCAGTFHLEASPDTGCQWGPRVIGSASYYGCDHPPCDGTGTTYYTVKLQVARSGGGYGVLIWAEETSNPSYGYGIFSESAPTNHCQTVMMSTTNNDPCNMHTPGSVSITPCGCPQPSNGPECGVWHDCPDCSWSTNRPSQPGPCYVWSGPPDCTWSNTCVPTSPQPPCTVWRECPDCTWSNVCGRCQSCVNGVCSGPPPTTNCVAAGRFSGGSAGASPSAACWSNSMTFSASASAVAGTIRIITPHGDCSVSTNNTSDSVTGTNYTWSLSGGASGPGSSLTTNLPPGVYIWTCTVAATNKICGVVSTNLVATGTVVSVNLNVDTDRNGIVDNDDQSGKEQWTLARGALTPPRLIDLNSSNSLDALPTLIVRPPGASPAGYSLRLHVSGDLSSPNDSFRLLDAGKTNLAVDSNGYCPLSLWPTNGATFYLASQHARRTATDFGDFPTQFTVDLELKQPDGTVACSDRIKLAVAPLILPPETNAVQQVYSTVNIPGISGLTVLPTGGSHFLQDQVKFTKVQIRSNANDDVYVLLNHWNPGSLATVLRTNNLVGVSWPLNDLGNGGNMMVTPPFTDAPYGKLLLGSGHPGSESYWNGQNVQFVVTTLDTTWLAVGHVDEVIMFVAPNKVLFADPWKAADLLHGEIAAGNGANTIWFGGYMLASSSRAKTIQNVVIATNAVGNLKVTTLPISLPNSTLTTNLVFTNNLFEVGDRLRVDNEVLSVTAISSPTVTVARAQYGRPAGSHASNSVIYAYSNVMRRNLPEDPSQSAQKSIESVTNALYLALGAYASSVTFTSMPVLFDLANTTPPKFLANSANVVNCLVVGGGTVYYQNTGCAVFENYISAVVPGAHAVDAWDDLHQLEGEIHCGTAARRSLDAVPPWWQLVPVDWN